MIAGFACGLLTYCMTSFPVAMAFGLSGDVWGGVCMLWGVICGSAGVMWGISRA